MRLKEILTKRYTLRAPSKHTLLHYSHTLTHSTYLGAVAWAGHGLYSYAAGALLLVIVLGICLGEEL